MVYDALVPFGDDCCAFLVSASACPSPRDVFRPWKVGVAAPLQVPPSSAQPSTPGFLLPRFASARPGRQEGRF
jgi:hypothetical protein